MFRRYIVAGLSAAAMLGLAGAPSAAPARTITASAAKTCGRGYTTANIGGQTKCLRRGEYCAVRYKSTYRRYGYTCSGSPARLH